MKKNRVNLVVDIGNTAVKIAVFSGKKMVQFKSVKPDSLKTEALLYIDQTKPDGIIFSSVTKISLKQLINDFKKKYTPNVFQLNQDLMLPVRNSYLTPETLGNDRLANAVAAFAKNPGKPSLVIDAGTCLKFDVVDAIGTYLGGAISPGLEMRFKALNNFTAQLPLYKPARTTRLTGRNTEESIYSGVYLGMIAEMKGTIESYKSKYPDLKIILTGGDMDLFAKDLKNGIFADRFLTLKGLNVILNYNE